MSLFVVTREENDYDQYGEYFVAAFSSRPTFEQLRKVLPGYEKEEVVEHLMHGGGRMEYEETWYHLHEVQEGRAF